MPDNWEPDDVFHKKTDGVYNGVRFVQKALAEARMPPFGKHVVTSRDKGMRKVEELLRRPNMPEGIVKTQLPIIISAGRPSFLFITFSAPNVHVPKHMHPDDAITRVIMSGSITMEGVELTMGDWAYVPNCVPYAYTAGPYGATILHLYNCGGGDDDEAYDRWKIHAFPGGGLTILPGLPKSEVPLEWFSVPPVRDSPQEATAEKGKPPTES
ncbi:hypothetical protein [Rhizobium sp. BK376]|uniref:hypothetical protein n=1 Tax=Rhizobium sp. BK376 TaxID=2512149 RepID=UPI00104EB546|nr:hypothetical protein [Rhizobium sp. BK376]TCR82286.1 hypothetical protein EV561_111191 [Rhizobium sp. BK376]